MPPAKASRYLFDRYRVSDTSFQEAIVLALAGALVTNRLQPRTAERIAARTVSGGA